MEEITGQIKNLLKSSTSKVKNIGVKKGLLYLGVGWLTYAISTYYIAKVIEKSKKLGAYTTGDDIMKGHKLTDKNVIITGASSGLGEETTRILLKYGANVYMACRNKKKADSVKSKLIKTLKADKIDITDKRLQVLEIDLSSLQSVNDFVEDIISRKIKIDYLINNAGVMAPPTYRTTKDDIEWQFGINHLGHYYMTRLLMPVLKESRTRIVNLSSVAYRFASYKSTLNLFNNCSANKCYMGDMKNTYKPFIAYGVSKSANILFTHYLNKNYNNHGIYSCAVHPGGINTNLARDVSLKDLLPIFALLIFVPFTIPSRIKSIQCGVSTTLNCCIISNDYITNANSIYYSNCLPVKCKKNTAANVKDDNDAIIQKLIELSDILIESKGFKIPK